MNPLSGFPLLTLIVFLPVLGAVINLFVPQERRIASRWLVTLIAATDLILVLLLYMGWADEPSGSPQFVDGPRSWIASLGIGYHLAVDGINLHLILLTALITPLTMAFSWMQTPDADNYKAHTFWTLLFQTALLGALTAFDLVLLSIFWVIAMVAAFFVVGGRGRFSGAATQLFVAVALVAVALLAAEIGLASHQTSFGLQDLSGTSFPWQAQVWMFWAVAIACAITGAIFPLHLWYPTAQRHTPAAAQVLVGSLLLNLGGYGLIRVCLPLFPLAAASFGPAIMIASTVGVLYAVLAALGQKSLPGTLAYWNVAQMGLVVIGIFSLQNLGLQGTVIHMVGCSLATTTLRLLSAGSTEDQRQNSAKGSSRWWSLATLAIGLLSAIGVPGLLGFVGNSTLILGIVRWRWDTAESSAGAMWDWIWYVLVFLGLLLGTWSLLRATLRTQLPVAGQTQSQRIVLLVPIVIIIVVVGLRPTLATDITAPPVYRLLTEVRLGIDRDLRQFGSPGQPGEEAPPAPAAPDNGEEAAWLPMWTQHVQVPVQFIE